MIWMIGWLACVVGIFRFVFLDPINEPHTFIGYFASAMIWGFLSFLSALPWVGLALLVGRAFQTKAIEDHSQELAALRIKDGVNGQFYLGSGTVKGAQYYFYYAKNSDGSFEPSQVSADGDINIFEEDRKDATVTMYKAEFVKSWPWIVGMPTLQGKKSVVFRVPTGTIKLGYEM